jgi:hypothetical protein
MDAAVRNVTVAALPPRVDGASDESLWSASHCPTGLPASERTWGKEAEGAGLLDGLGSPVHFELGADVLDVRLDCAHPEV